MHRFVICITGASGVVYAVGLVEELKRRLDCEIILIISKWGWKVIMYELDIADRVRLFKYVDKYYTDDELDSEIASGSSKFDAVIVVPCSMKTLSDIVNSRPDTLITRVVDVALKENRKVVIVPRETPTNQIHLKNMYKARKIGINIVIPSPAYYINPKSVNDIVNYIVGKILDILGIEHNLYKRWRQ